MAKRHSPRAIKVARFRVSPALIGPQPASSPGYSSLPSRVDSRARSSIPAPTLSSGAAIAVDQAGVTGVFGSFGQRVDVPAGRGDPLDRQVEPGQVRRAVRIAVTDHLSLGHCLFVAPPGPTWASAARRVSTSAARTSSAKNSSGVGIPGQLAIRSWTAHPDFGHSCHQLGPIVIELPIAALSTCTQSKPDNRARSIPDHTADNWGLGGISARSSGINCLLDMRSRYNPTPTKSGRRRTALDQVKPAAGRVQFLRLANGRWPYLVTISAMSRLSMPAGSRTGVDLTHHCTEPGTGLTSPSGTSR